MLTRNAESRIKDEILTRDYKAGRSEKDDRNFIDPNSEQVFGQNQTIKFKKETLKQKEAEVRVQKINEVREQGFLNPDLLGTYNRYCFDPLNKDFFRYK
jgi:PDZ domain-containing secreted protein